MASAREIRSKITSIHNTQKITKAMEMVAASKMRRTYDRMIASRPYADTISKVITHLIHINMEYKHPYLNQRDTNRIGYLVVSTDRGLAGALNINLFKKILADMKKQHEQGVKTELALIGTKAVSFFNSLGRKAVSELTGIGDNPNITELLGPIKIMLQLYDEKWLDKIYIVSNKFINTMSYIPEISQIIPLIPIDNTCIKIRSWDYLYESDPEILIDTLLRRYIDSQVYQGVIENLASEQAARMVAMKAATDNGASLMKEMHIIYNKVRQANITQEINEIVSGASAVV